MTAITESMTQKLNAAFEGRINWRYFLQDNVTGSWYLAVWVVVLAAATVAYTINQMNVAPLTTIIILILWLVGLGFAIANGLFKKRTAIGSWLKTNLLGSVSNAILSLLLVLILAAAVRGIWSWAVTNATFDPELTKPEFRNPDGATWGVIPGAWELLMVGRLDREALPRVQMALGYIVVLGVISIGANVAGYLKKIRPLRSILLGLWAITPIIVYILLAGVSAEGDFINSKTLLIGEAVVVGLFLLLWWQRTVKFSVVNLVIWAAAWPVAYLIWRAIGKSEMFPPINVATWGGLMLTIIIAVSVIILSFPLGMVLALGRRSEIRGIPGWLLWPVAAILALWGLFVSTPSILGDIRNQADYVLAFWPILILGFAYLLQKMFQGNVVAAASTTFIEVIRGAPLITLLFMAIIMAPFFLSEGATLENVWAVIIGYSLFSSAYMAENIRGGLQALPKGQFEAADSLGLNTFQKMRFIILPQALRIVIPAIVGQFIGSFKSSSLVAIVGLFELLGMVAVIVSNPQWLGLRKELFVFAGVIYFIGSAVMSWYSRRLEAQLGVGER